MDTVDLIPVAEEVPGVDLDRPEPTESELAEQRLVVVLARCTALENEKREWKLRAETAAAFLKDVLVDLPLSMRLVRGGAPMATALAELLGHISREAERSDQLQKDAWCGAVDLVRRFVAEAKECEAGGWTEDKSLGFILRWLADFRAVLE